MSDDEAQEIFQYREVAAREHYRIYEHPGRCWLLAYLVPIGLIVGAYVSWPIEHVWIHQHLCSNDITYGASILVTAACAASGFGLASLIREETHSDRAFQPLLCGWLSLLFLLVWWITK
jgi:hypothetical protein